MNRSLLDPAVVLGPEHKSFPAESWGAPAAAFVAGRPGLDRMQTPLLTVDAGAVARNTRTMADWAARSGLALAPHGKTSMAPALWGRFLDAGAWGVTLATPWQVQVGRAAGVERILLANELVDPVAVAWIVGESRRDPDFEFVCWADSVAAVQRLDDLVSRADPARPVDVLVELGAPGGRTGARTAETALEVADALIGSRYLRLAGTGGYEGAVAHDRSPEALARVRAYLQALLDLHRALGDRCSGDRRPLLTAGGSAYFDLVAEVFAPETASSTVVLRSGAYQFHDDGFYDRVSPLGATATGPRLTAALHGWARVLSRPEPGLAILDAGKRDLPFDEGLPVAQRILGTPRAEAERALTGSRVAALNDQHLFLRLADGVDEDVLPVGTVVRLGISHPCTAFDKWRLLPMIDDAESDLPHLVDVLPTWF